MIRKCEQCSEFFEYDPPEDTRVLRRFCQRCLIIRNKRYLRKRDLGAVLGRCEVCHKPTKKVGAETCGKGCSKELYNRRQRGDCPAEKSLCEELHFGFTWDEPSMMGI